MGLTKSLSIESITALMTLLLITSTVSAQKWGEVSDEEWAAAAPTDYPEATAIILFDIGKVEVTRDRIRIDYHTRIKILTQTGAEDDGEWAFSWYGDGDKIKNFKAHTITPDGKKHKINKNAVFETRTGDWKTKTFAFSKLAPGVILEFKYTHKSERFRYLRPWYFQNHLYTIRSQVTAGVAAGFAYDVDFYNVPGRNRKATESKYIDPQSTSMPPGYIKTFTWQMENIRPISDEPYMSARNDYRAFVQFQIESFSYGLDRISYVQTWPEEGDDFRRYVSDDYDKAGSRIKKLVERITAEMTSPRQKSRAIFDWVTDSISTIDKDSRKWFYQKNLTKLLDERVGFGEDKNYLMAKMHNAVGIEAWPVLISTRQHGRFNPLNGDFRQFNYLITFIQMGDEWEFLDASGRYTPYGVLPPNLLTDGGLLLDGSKSDLVQIAIKPTESHRYDSTMIVIDSAGQVTGNIRCHFSGYYAAAFSRIEQRLQPDEFIDDYFGGRVEAECEWNDLAFAKDSLDNLIGTINFSSAEMLTELGENILITPIRLAYGDNIFTTNKRFFPVDFMYPFVYTSRVDIVSQMEYSEIALPPDTTFEIQGAKFERHSEAHDSVATVIVQLTIAQPEFKPRKYARLRRFFESVALTKEDPVAFVK